ncbi:hypothetical protein PHYBOEH_007756 [Phytophthora boehmeriae]|uniref:Secretory lipase n=1 Tax=Phytophthora boehmeriae TaxID=109152 RepID=A0A8T1W481_9STRA|nr:hypothetical protein PHYBOEH_007756 [Phytophthora boehmeriae]
MLGLLLTALLASAHSVAAKQASNFDVSAATAESYQCGPSCQEVLKTTNAADLQTVGADFDWDFYAVADNFSTAKPGDLLKLKPVNPTNLTTISGVSVYRIQYVSEDLNGTYLPVSGYIALPFSLPDSGAFPLVAWAHGTIGAYHGCAISNGPNLFDYHSWSLLSESGYAIVGTDYAGLGTYGTDHKYCAFPAHAKDLYYSVTAARQAFGSVLSAEWMSVGHSQGGGAVWKLAEDVDTIAAAQCSSRTQSQNQEQDTRQTECRSEADHYLGTVALAPATKIWDMVQLAAKQLLSSSNVHSSSGASLLPMIDIAIKRVFPEYNSTILGDTLKARMGLADEAQLCASALLGLTLDLDVADMTSLSTSGMSASDVMLAEQFQNTTAPANGVAAHGPILVVQGVNDTAILAETTEQAYESACSDGSEVHLNLYPKQDHSGVLTAAAPDWLKWMSDRFAGKAAAGQCSKQTKQAFDYEFVRAVPEVDLSTNSLN